MKKEIRHRIKNVYKQGNRPICGIYAFLNGIFYNEVSNPPRKYEIDELAKDLWKEAIKSGYSTIGEFFSSNNLIQFLNSKSVLNNDKLIKEMNSHGVTGFKVEKEISFNEPDKEKLILKIEEVLKNIKKDEFFLIPINSGSGGYKDKNAENMHWICYKRDKEKKLTIFDSSPSIGTRIFSLLNERAVPEGRALENSKVNENRNIYTIKELATVYENMYNRESEYEEDEGKHACFDFYNWVPKKTEKMEGKSQNDASLLKDYWTKLHKIKKAGEGKYKYKFNKNEFGIIPVKIITKNTEFDDQYRIKGALYPYDDQPKNQSEPQWTKLKAALSDKNITNIAITSSYDAGKTSFLKSFFKTEYKENNHIFKRKYGKNRYKFITIPTFSEKQANIDEENLEKNVINQLLFSENFKGFPDSHIDRMHVYSNWWAFFIWLVLWTLGILIFLLTSIAPKVWHDNLYRKSIMFAIFVIALAVSGWLIYHIVHDFYKLSWNAKASLGPVELSSADNKDDDKQSGQNLFILYGDEIKYYFYRSKVEFVIFEDMDRFNNIDIFQKLRELNKNINGSELLQKKKKKVVFIYTLSDAIFDNTKKLNNKETTLINENKAAESKAKFFDYVISLMPFDNLNSSEKVFRDEIGKYKDVKELNISDNILLGVSVYISDRREITCIVADMDTYLRSLNQIQPDLVLELKKEQSNFGDKLFAAMIYKNVYPQDFDNLAKGKSYLGYFLQEIDTLKAYIYNNQTDMDGSYISKFQNDDNIANLISVIWDNYYEFSLKNPNDLDDRLKSVIAYIKETNVLRFLLEKNLIEGDFYEFISPTQLESLSSPKQIMFIQNALARRRNDIDFEISDEKIVDKIIDILDAVGVDYSYVYSSSILERLINQNDKKNSVFQIIEGLSVIGRFDTGEKRNRIVNGKVQFIDKVITWLYTHKSEINNDNFTLLGYPLCEYWPRYFAVALKNKVCRTNAIKYALDFLAEDNEIENDGDSGLIEYLVGTGDIDQYAAEIENSSLSKENKEYVRRKIKEITKEVVRDQ